MKPFWHSYSEQIDLHVAGRIATSDAARQMATARALLERLATQPGVILADEVGMGKTFVALAVAVSVAISSKRPVVIMVPPALKEKWPQDFDVFRQHCWRGPEIRCVPAHGLAAEDGTEFLRLLDDPPSRRAHLIFLTHGALHRGLTDPLVKLAIIQRAIRGRRLGEFRLRLPELARELLHGGKQLKVDVISQLLKTDSADWRMILGGDDDPIPADVRAALVDDRAEEIHEILWTLSRSRRADRVQRARHAMTAHLRGIWKRVLSNLSTRLPLLVLDEAHHAKNAGTRLAGLVSTEGREDGPSLQGLCERYLFLTATPFQLGHDELCGVIGRFGGINWKSRRAPGVKEEFDAGVAELHTVLDRAQRTAQDFERQWARLRQEDLLASGERHSTPDAWWQAISNGASAEGRSSSVAAAAKDLHNVLRDAEMKLRPWVVRHLKPREFDVGGHRRHRLAGDAIESYREDEIIPLGEPKGLEISGAAVLPFLLAARAATLTNSGTLFAEGLASSYEAFRFTCTDPLGALDDDEGRGDGMDAQRPESWHLDRIAAALPRGNLARAEEHPKIHATVERALELWRQREKVLVFCYFRQTGTVLREVLSTRLEEEIRSCVSDEAHQRWAQLLDQPRSKPRRACDREISALLEAQPSLFPHAEMLNDIVRRFLRTPAYMARYSSAAEVSDPSDAFAVVDASGLSLRARLSQWFGFLADRCTSSERKATLDALKRISTGEHAADEAGGTGSTQLSPLVRLVRGGVGDETRRRLALAFNAPFFPEILIASSVMAEGVDLHRSCRHVIHHDLCWNPATLEQRTGRLDRIGGKHEQATRPLHIWLPWLAGTQDEKQYRVVTLRERWFGIVMGEKSGPVASGSVEAESLLLPDALARQLALRLEAVP